MAAETLFREEVRLARLRRLDGEVIVIHPRLHSAGAALTILIVCVALLVISLLSYTRKERVRGYLAPAAGVSDIFPTQAADVDEIFVVEGQSVEKGAALLSVKNETVMREGDSLERTTLATLQSERRLNLERAALTEEKAALDESRLAAEAERLQSERSSAAQQMQYREDLVASAKRSWEKVQETYEKGYITSVDWETRKQAYLSQQIQLEQIKQSVADLEIRIAEARSDLDQVVARKKGELAELENGRAEIDRQIADWNSRRSRIITATISGKVSGLQASVGQHLDPTIPIMSIVPPELALEAKLLISVTASGLVKSGQEIRFRFDAFPYHQFGDVSGRLGAVARSIRAPKDLKAPIAIDGPVYLGSAELDASSIEKSGAIYPLQAGMTFEATIVLGRRQIIDWVLEPFN